MPEVWETLLHWRCSQLPIFHILLPCSAPRLLAEFPGSSLLLLTGRERHDRDTASLCVEGKWAKYLSGRGVYLK